VMEVIIFIFSYFFGFAEGFWAISDQCF
jgi:hypothetical protein